jgi:hypothetical protein
LDFVREKYGDLECAVHAESEVPPVKLPRVHVLQDFDFGASDLMKTGDRVTVLWPKPGIGMILRALRPHPYQHSKRSEGLVGS